MSNIDLLGRLGCMAPALANAVLEFRPMRALMQGTLGLSAKRSLPHYTRQRFDEWFARHLGGSARRGVPVRGRVVLWDDTFVRYHEPHIGIAAVKVLEALGLDVEMARDRRCCGRPAFSQGNLDVATEFGQHNIDLLGRAGDSTPIVFLEPSCYSMFAEDYRELKISGAEKVAARCFLFENFIDDLLARDPTALPFKNGHAKDSTVHVAIHAHCHAKALMNPGFMTRLAERLPGRKATLLETGCCGMAGAFGALASKYELSLQVAEPLVRKIEEQPAGSTIVASGTSCRHQISDLTSVRPQHMAEVIAEAI